MLYAAISASVAVFYCIAFATFAALQLISA